MHVRCTECMHRALYSTRTDYSRTRSVRLFTVLVCGLERRQSGGEFLCKRVRFGLRLESLLTAHVTLLSVTEGRLRGWSASLPFEFI